MLWHLKQLNLTHNSFATASDYSFGAVFLLELLKSLIYYVF